MFCVACMIFANDVAVKFAMALLFRIRTCICRCVMHGCFLFEACRHAICRGFLVFVIVQVHLALKCVIVQVR